MTPESMAMRRAEAAHSDSADSDTYHCHYGADPFNGYRIRGSHQSIILIRDQLGDRGIVIRRHTITLDETGLNTDAFFF